MEMLPLPLVLLFCLVLHRKTTIYLDELLLLPYPNNNPDHNNDYMNTTKSRHLVEELCHNSHILPMLAQRQQLLLSLPK